MPHGENHPRGDSHRWYPGLRRNPSLSTSPESNDVSSSSVMNVQSTRVNVTRPLRSGPWAFSNADHIYVGGQRFPISQRNGPAPPQSMSSLDGGRDLQILFHRVRANTAGTEMGLPFVPASAADIPLVRSLFRLAQIRRQNRHQPTLLSSLMMVGWALAPNPFQSLRAPSDNFRARLVVQAQPPSRGPIHPRSGQETPSVSNGFPSPLIPITAPRSYVGWGKGIAGAKEISIPSTCAARPTAVGEPGPRRTCLNTTISNAN